MQKSTPHIAIVGAGPGDPDLLTIRAMRTLQEADVVLYDSLVNAEILEYAGQAIKVPVGKRAGQPSFPQSDIQLLMVQYAYTHGRVVRLKGGDPFVFGRGHEELEYIQAFNIPVEVIPGISSAIAVPASQSIPVTRRGVAESFWVVTATTKSGALSNDIHLAAASSATVVILMGLRKLPEIVEAFKGESKEDLPVMVIQDGTLSTERCAVGTINTIQTEVAKAKIKTPATIVAGEVVSFHPAYVPALKRILQ